MINARYIIPRELSTRVFQTLASRPNFVKSHDHHGRKIGLCVSGGADSMALAYLLHNVYHPDDTGKKAFLIHAFIADHGVRRESAAEASKVKGYLQALGIETSILKLKLEWRVDTPMHGFEERARRERYRAIALAAYNLGIYDIFTGHHHDDQMETLLLRLVMNTSINPLSLQGMSLTSAVPCCEDLPGVRPSSSLIGHATRGKYLFGPRRDHRSDEFVSHAGMQLVRPLLDYSKARILATCDHFSIPFVVDKTNLDPTFTSRNAVRSLRSFSAMPRALQDHSLSSIRNRMELLVRTAEQNSIQLAQRLTKFHLHSRTGTIRFSMRRLPHELSSSELQAFAYAMARLVEVVSPGKSEHIPTLLARRDVQMLLDLGLQNVGHIPPNGSCASHWSRPTSTTINSVIFTFSRRNDVGEEHESITMARQPMRSREIAENTSTFRVSIEDSQQDGVYKSDWLFWDRRFWIQLTSPNPNLIKEISIAPFTKVFRTDTTGTPAIKRVLSESGRWKDFTRMMAIEAPGESQYTQPVLLYQERIVAFPMLDFVIEPETVKGLEWITSVMRSTRSIAFLKSLSLTNNQTVSQ